MQLFTRHKQKNIRLYTYITVIICIIFSLEEYFTYNKLQHDILNKRLHTAEVIRDLVMSIRKVYQHQFLYSKIELNKNTVGFLPAHALGKISIEFQKMNRLGITFNNVSDNPRNIRNKADLFEQKAIKYFKQHPKQEVFTSNFVENNTKYYHYARPIKIKLTCLKCHGPKEKAPLAIQKLYNSAYNYHVGDLRGIFSVRIPEHSILTYLQNRFWKSFYFRLAALLIILIILFIILELYFKQRAAIELDLAQKDRQIQHKSRLALMGELVAGVGHEINHPLAVSMGNLSILQKELEHGDMDRDKILEKLSKLSLGHQKIKQIVDGLRNYARSNDEQEGIFTVNEAIKQTLDLLNDIYKQYGITLIYNNPSTPYLTQGNLNKLQQVLMNLISNAKDATEEKKHPIIKIILTEDPNSNHIAIHIVDNGTGIPEEIKDKITSPFFTTKEAGKGTGIGLGVVNEIIKSMQGELKIESTLGKGSTFTILLPKATQDDKNVD